MRAVPPSGRSFLTLVFLIALRKACGEFGTPANNDASQYLIGSFHSLPNTTFTLLKVYQGSIYLACGNLLFHLSLEFVAMRGLSIMDDQEGVYRILAVSESKELLVSCRRHCEFRNLSNINQIFPFREDYSGNIVFQGDYPIVGLLGPSMHSSEESLYVARGMKGFSTKSPIIEIKLRGDTDGIDRRTNAISSAVDRGFVIYYSGTFVYEGFVYFLASQRMVAKDEGSEIIPKLSRLCLNGENFDAFTEIELRCRGKTEKIYSLSQSYFVYGNSLFIVFNENIGPNNVFNPGSHSALCVYNMTNLKQSFQYAVDACACDKNNANNINYLHQAVCTNREILQHNPHFCDKIEKNVRDRFVCYPNNLFRYPESSADQDPVIEIAVLEQSDACFSSLTITEIWNNQNHTIALIGTREGAILKTVLRKNESLIYENVTIGSPVLADTTLTDDNKNLLVLTKEKVVKIKITDCTQYSTCQECIRPGDSMGDPHCGWCTLERSCTQFMECPKNLQESRWLAYDESHCVAITNVSPSVIKEDSVLINMTITRLPALAVGESYECHFNDIVSPAKINEGVLQCISPDRDELPLLEEGENSLKMKLHVFSTETGINFINTDHQFIFCSIIKSCSDCVNFKQLNCDWCKYEHRCVVANTSCNNRIYGVHTLRGGRMAADACPRIVVQKVKYIPTDVSQKISFQAKNLILDHPSDTIKRYTCQLKLINGSASEVEYVTKASLKTNDNIMFDVTCENQKYIYNKNVQYLNATLTLKWNSGNKVDGNQPVRIYSCSYNCLDCECCLTANTWPEELICGWCSESKRCTAKGNCLTWHNQSCLAPNMNTDLDMASNPRLWVVVISIVSVAILVAVAVLEFKRRANKEKVHHSYPEFQIRDLPISTGNTNKQTSPFAVQTGSSAGNVEDEAQMVPNTESPKVIARRKQDKLPQLPRLSRPRVSTIYEDFPEEAHYSHAFYSKESAPLPSEFFSDYIHEKKFNRRNRLEKEFVMLPNGQLEAWTEATKKENVGRCRNPDVLPYDSSRVKVAVEWQHQSDFYNASYVMDEHNRKCFVAAESPTKNTADEFIRIIWQQKVNIVVMLSDWNDTVKDTSLAYWPTEEGTPKRYGILSITLNSVRKYPDHTVRSLLIRCTRSSSITVTQFHYHSWPYKRAVDHPSSLLCLLNDVKMCLKEKRLPLLVHCSDGAGATGTFIALFCLLDELSQSSEISVYNCVKELRKNRINMVSTKAQYFSIYDVLLLSYNTPISAYQMSDFKELEIGKKLEELSNEFQLLPKPNFTIDAQSGSSTENKKRNRFYDIIPFDLSRPHLRCESLLGGTDYINACFANSYFKKNAFILTQSPLPVTVEDFWRMVCDTKCNKIVMLHQLDPADKTCNFYWPNGGSVQYGSMLVECVVTVTDDLFVCRNMKVKHQDEEDVLELKHFQLLKWPHGMADVRELVDFHEVVGIRDGTETVIVHCIDGASRSGVFVAIHNELQRLRDTGKVNIFQTIQSLRERTPYVCSTLKEYLLCYETLQAFAKGVEDK